MKPKPYTLYSCSTSIGLLGIIRSQVSKLQSHKTHVDWLYSLMTCPTSWTLRSSSTRWSSRDVNKASPQSVNSASSTESMSDRSAVPSHVPSTALSSVCGLGRRGPQGPNQTKKTSHLGWCPPASYWVTMVTFWPQLQAAASAKETLNIDCSDPMNPAFAKICWKQQHDL